MQKPGSNSEMLISLQRNIHRLIFQRLQKGVGEGWDGAKIVGELKKNGYLKKLGK